MIDGKYGSEFLKKPASVEVIKLKGEHLNLETTLARPQHSTDTDQIVLIRLTDQRTDRHLIATGIFHLKGDIVVWDDFEVDYDLRLEGLYDEFRRRALARAMGPEAAKSLATDHCALNAPW